MPDTQLSSVLDKLGVVKDAMTVSRVFGESYQSTESPLSRLPRCERRWGRWWRRKRTGRGRHRHRRGARIRRDRSALGVYIVKDGEVSWQPAIDVLRIVVGGQLLALAAILALRRRHKRR
jgi:hypothetical protein